MEFTVLKPEQWGLVESYVWDDIKWPMPVPTAATFPALLTPEGALAGFLWVEHLYHFKNLIVVPEYRHRGLAMRLLTEAAARIPKGHSAICLPDPKHEGMIRLAESIGARQLLSRVVLRKDVPK